jgi:hypothetical protein
MTVPKSNEKDPVEDKPKLVDIDTKAPAAPDLPYRPGEVGSWDGFGAANKSSDSDSQPPVEPAGEDEPIESFRDPVKEGV